MNDLELLGFEVEDVVTGFHGVVSSINFDLYGCIQAAVTPRQNDKGELPEPRWFDTNRLKKKSKTPVMSQPEFAKVKGGQDLSKVRSSSLPPR